MLLGSGNAAEGEEDDEEEFDVECHSLSFTLLTTFLALRTTYLIVFLPSVTSASTLLLEETAAAFTVELVVFVPNLLFAFTLCAFYCNTV